MKKKNHGRDRIEMVCLVPIANDEEPLKEDEALHGLLFTSKHKKRRKKRKKKKCLELRDEGENCEKGNE